MICFQCEKETENFFKSDFKRPSHYKKICKKCTNKNRREKNAEKKRAGFIYIITNPAWKGWSKIGLTISSPKNRLSAYQVSTPFRDFKVNFSIEVEDVDYIEKEIHDKLRSKDILNNGEWFFISVKEAKKEIIIRVENEN